MTSERHRSRSPRNALLPLSVKDVDDAGHPQRHLPLTYAIAEDARPSPPLCDDSVACVGYFRCVNVLEGKDLLRISQGTSVGGQALCEPCTITAEGAAYDATLDDMYYPSTEYLDFLAEEELAVADLGGQAPCLHAAVSGVSVTG